VPLACLLVKYADKVNWVHDPASLAGQSIGRGRDERYSGRFLKVLITRRLRKKDGCLGRDVLEGRRGVTGQSGPRAGLGGADFLQSRPRLPRSRVASLQQLLGSALVLVPVLVLVWCKGNYQV